MNFSMLAYMRYSNSPFELQIHMHYSDYWYMYKTFFQKIKIKDDDDDNDKKERNNDHTNLNIKSIV